MKFNNEDILITSGGNIGKSLSDVINKQSEDIENLKSNVKYIYTHGGVGSGSSGSSSGSSSSTWDALVTVGGTTIADGGNIIFTKPGAYTLFVKIMRANNGTYSIKYKSECESNEDAHGEIENSFDKLYQFETSINLSNNNKYVSVIIEDDMGTLKVIKCQYIVNPIVSDFKLYKGGSTVNENLNGGMLLLSSSGITRHSDSPYIEFSYSLGVPVTDVSMTFAFGNYLNTSKVATSYNSADDLEFFDPDLYNITSNTKNGRLKLDMKTPKTSETVKIYLNDIVSAVGDGKDLSILNPVNSSQYNISVSFSAVSSIGAMTSSLKVSFIAVPENVFMVVGDISETTHYYSQNDVSTTNDNGDLLASNESLWTKKDTETTQYIYNALTVGDGLTSNVKVFEGELSANRKDYRVTWTLTPSYSTFDSRMMMTISQFKEEYLKTTNHSNDDNVISQLYNWYENKFYTDHLNNFYKIIWMDGSDYTETYTYTYKENDILGCEAKDFTITKTFSFTTDDSIRTSSITVTEQSYKQINIPTIQTLGLNKVNWKVAGVKKTNKSYELDYYFYVKSKPKSVNWLLERMYDTTVTSTGNSMKLSSHYLNLDPDKTDGIPVYKSNLNITGSSANLNSFGTTVSKISTRTTDASTVVITPTNVGYTSSTINLDTIISFSMRYSDLNNEDTPILKITYNNKQSDITFRKNYIFSDTNKICIPSEKIGDTTKQHLIQLVNHSIWSDEAIGQSQSKYITMVYIDGVADNTYTSYSSSAMKVDTIELFKCDVDYNLIDIEYYKPLIIRKTYVPTVLDKYDESTDTVYTKTGDEINQDRDILDMFMYNYWLRYNSSYNGVEFDGSYDQIISNPDGVLSNIIFDGGHIKVLSESWLDLIARNSAIPTLVLSMNYKVSNQNGGYVMDRIQVEGSGNGSTAIDNFGEYELDDILWSDGKGKALNSQLITADSTDDFETPKYYFKLQGSSTVNNRAKNLTLGIRSPQNKEKKTVLFSPNYNSTDSTTFLPEQKWTLKTDVADSAHANNTSIGKFVNAVTESPNRGTGKNNIKHLKNCLEGIPIMVFFRTNNNTELVEYNYLGMFNFNLGRDSKYNLGYNTLSNTNEMINSITRSTSFAYAFVDDIVNETGLMVGEISGNTPRFDFSQWNENLLIDPKNTDDSHYMYGDLVNPVNANVLTTMSHQVSLAGRFIFQKLGRHFNEGWHDSTTDTEGYRTYDSNKNTYVNGFTHQYKWSGSAWEVDKNDDGSEKYDTTLGDYDSVYALITDRIHEPNETETESQVVNQDGPMLDFTSLSEYYTICIAFGMVDSVLKNLNIKSWNGRTCYCQFYDMDCANGENNDGAEVIDYNVAMDYWSCKESGGYVDGIEIQFDYWPASGSKDEDGESITQTGYDFPSHYLFAVAKYGRQIMGMIDNNTTGIQKTQKYPQQFWAMMRSIPNESVLNTDGQIKYGKAHGELRSAEYFVNKYFNSGLGSMAKLMVNLNYDYKYFYRDDISTASTDTSSFGKSISFHGTRQYKVKEWLDKRFHFLDAMFQLDNVSLVAGKITTNTYQTIEEYNNLVGGVTSGWTYNNFTLDSYKSYLDNEIPYYMTLDNTFFVNTDDITSNTDVYIQSSAFHDRGDDPRQIGQGQHIVNFKCKPNTLLTIVNGEETSRYMLTKSASELQKIKIDLGGAKVLKVFGSKEITYLENINAFLQKNTKVKSNNLTQIIASEESTVNSFLINAPMCTKIILNKPTYQGTLQFEETVYTNEKGETITKTALEDMTLLTEIDISNSGLTCSSDTVYFDGNNTCTLSTLSINGVQSNNGIIKVSDMPNLTTINMSGSSNRPTVLKTLDISCIRNNVTLNNTQITNIKLEVSNDCRNNDIEFVINSDSVVENLELVGFKKITINTCQNLKSLIIRDNNETQDIHKLSDLTINDYSASATTSTSVTSISKDSSSEETSVYDLRHLVNLKNLELGRCNSMKTLRLPGHVIDMSSSDKKFYYDEGLYYIEGDEGYGIFVNNSSTFGSFFFNTPITMLESDKTTLSSIYLGTSVTTATSTWGWHGAFSMDIVKYILDNLFKDRYTYTGTTYNKDGSINVKSHVTHVDGDYRSSMTNLNSCFYYKSIKYTINQAEKDYITCNAVSTSDINSAVTKYKKRNLTTFTADTFTIGNTSDTAISDKVTTQSINGTNLIRPYMEAYTNLTGDNIFPRYPESTFLDYDDLTQLKANACIYTKGFLSYGSNASSVTGLPMYASDRHSTTETIVYNLMLDTFENVGSKMTSFKLNNETNYYPTSRFWMYDSSLKQLVLISSRITLKTFFDNLPNLTSLTHFNLYSGQTFSFTNAFASLTSLNTVSGLCYYVPLSNISGIDELFKNNPIIKCDKIFTESALTSTDDESASPFGTSKGTNTGNKTTYSGERINIATFFNYDTPNIQYLLNADTNKQIEVCMPIPRYVTYSDFISIWDKLTAGSSTTLTYVDNLFADTVILMPNGSYSFNTNSPYNISCNSSYRLSLGKKSNTIFTKLKSARHLFDNFEMWYIKNYYSGNDSSVALSGFNNNTIYTIGSSTGNSNLKSGGGNLKCKLPIFTITRTFTPIYNESKAVIARDEDNSFLHKLKCCTDYAYAFRNLYFYKMLSYDFFAKRCGYSDAKVVADLYSYYEVPDEYSKPVDGQQKASSAIYYKKNSDGELEIITDDNYDGQRYQWGSATVLTYNYNGNISGSSTSNRITNLYRCFERTTFYNSGEIDDDSGLYPRSRTFMAATSDDYTTFTNANVTDYDSTVNSPYVGDRILQPSDFNVTYSLDGLTNLSTTFTTPYTRTANSNAHKIYGDKSSTPRSIPNGATWINGLDFSKGIPGGNNTYDRLDTFYVKSGSSIPYVIIENSGNEDGNVFNIYSDRKNYTITDTLITNVIQLSNQYNVYSKNDNYSSSIYYYIPTKTTSNLSDKFELKSSSNKSTSFKTSKSQKGIRYAMYDWTSSTLLNEDYILLSDGKKYKYYTNPNVVYKFASITNDESDLWYISNSYIGVTNTYTQSGSSDPSYTWNISYNSNSLGYSGTVDLNNVMNSTNQSILTEVPSYNHNVLSDIIAGYNPVYTSASASDITLETISDYLTRVKVSTDINTSNPDATNRLSIQGTKNKHFCIDEVNSSYSGNSNYYSYIQSTYGFNFDKKIFDGTATLSNTQQVRKWLCELYGLSGYMPTSSNNSETATVIMTNETALNEVLSYDPDLDGKEHEVNLVGAPATNSFKNDFLQYCINLFKTSKYSGFSSAGDGVTYSGLNYTLPTITVQAIITDGEVTSVRYKFYNDRTYPNVTCYGPSISGTNYVYNENGTSLGSTTITKDDLFAKKIINDGVTVSPSGFRTLISTNLMTDSTSAAKVSIPVRYKQEKYYYCTYVFEEYTYTKASSIVKDSSYMDDVNAHIQLIGISSTDNNDNVVFGTPSYVEDGDDAIKESGSAYYKIECNRIYGYPTYPVSIDYTDNGETKSLSLSTEGGYYLCPPDLLRGCLLDGCDLRYLFSYSNIVGALHSKLLYNMKNTKISHWLRDVNVLPQYIGHNKHVKQYTFVPAGFNLSGDLSYAFDFKYRLPKTYNASYDNSGATDFNSNSEYFIVLKDSFSLISGTNTINVTSLSHAFSGKCYENRYKSIDEGSTWQNSGSVVYDYQPVRYTYNNNNPNLRGYNSHLYLCGTKGSNCYLPKGMPITLTGNIIKLDNMISGTNNVASYFMGPVFDSSVHGEDITNTYFDSTSGTAVIYAPNSLLHPSVELPVYLRNPATTTGMVKNNYGRIIYVYGAADYQRYRDGYAYLSADTLGGGDSAQAYRACPMPGVTAGTTSYVQILKYYTDSDDALANKAYYNMVIDNSATSSNVIPASFYNTCHTE